MSREGAGWARKILTTSPATMPPRREMSAGSGAIPQSTLERGESGPLQPRAEGVAQPLVLVREREGGQCPAGTGIQPHGLGLLDSSVSVAQHGTAAFREVIAGSAPNLLTPREPS